MFNPIDPFCYTTHGPLMKGDGSILGRFTSKYHTTHYEDVQLASGTARGGTANDGSRKYLLSCVQRIMIYNQSGTNLSPQPDLLSYLNYPALLNTLLQLLPQDGVSFQLVGYSPHTVNTKIQTSGTTGSSSGQTSGSSTSETVGSSTSQTNSYGVSVGTFGDVFTSGMTSDYAFTTTSDKSSTRSTETGHSDTQENSTSAYMSIMDWGAYALVNPQTNNPSWTFGQEYPWDAITCRKTANTPNPDNHEQVQLVIPNTMKVRLYDGAALYPPSHLSMFGINFVVAAQWMVTVGKGASSEVAIKHTVNYFSASHVLQDGNVSVYIDGVPSVLYVPGDAGGPVKLDLGVMGLRPVGNPNEPSVIGFVPSKYTNSPAPATEQTAPRPFSIFSSTNNLLACDTTQYPDSCTSGAGFRAESAALVATLTGNCTSLTFTLLFKVVDTTSACVLHLKHWKTTGTGVMLKIVVNGDTANALTKYVDAAEAAGGEHNLLSVSLRDIDYASVDYTDMLALGLNSVAVTLTPVGGTNAGYALRAVALEMA